jgi:hypothetical protein
MYEENYLLVPSIEFGVVMKIGSDMRHENQRQTLLEWYRLDGLETDTDRPHPSKNTCYDAWCRTLRGDCCGVIPSLRTIEECDPNFSSKIDQLFRKAISHSTWLDANAWDSSYNALDMVSTIINKISARRLFVTSTSYFGLANTNVQIGDQLCILVGGITPFLLRPKGFPG